LKTGASLGADSSLPASEQLLLRAFRLAEERLRSGFDAHALHVIARVYLAKRSPEAAVEPAKLALADPSDPARGHFLFTLGRAYLATGRTDDAQRAAELSLATGTTLGHELLADLLFREGEADETKQRHGEYVDLLGKVDDADRSAYYGTSRSGRDAASAVLESQKAKLAETVERGKSGWRSARAGIERLRAARST
jgi:tetratricopeptide (TPR) repeat protein